MKPIYAVLGIAVVSAAYTGTFPSPQAASWHEDADSITEVDSVAEVSIESVSDFFLFADEFNTIEQSVRMDMLDYYASGMRKHMPTRLGGQAVIDSIAGDHYMKVSTSSVSETEVQMYVNNHGDKLFGVINRVKMPATDSHISFSQTYALGSPSVSLIEEPKVRDFLTAKDKKTLSEIESKIDFPLIDYRFLPNGDVEARLTVGEFLSREDSAAVMPFVNSGITYHWDGKRFKIKK